jgi:hypothetical protein
MHTALKLELDESTISEPMSWDEICARYRDEWVVLVEIDWIDWNAFEFRTARVLSHSKRRDEPLEESKPWRWRFEATGHFFTGEIAPNTGFWDDWEFAK